MSGWDAAIGSIVRPSAHRGGTLRLGAGSGVDSLDPARTYYVWVWLLQRMLNRTLMAYPLDPGPGGRTPVPDLAEEPGCPSADHRTWTYRLRRGVRFDDGREVVADDVAYAISRPFSRHAVHGGPTWLLSLLDDPAAPCAGPFGGAGSRARPAGLEVVDKRTLVLHLRSPFRDLDHLLCQPGTAPVPAERDGGASYGDGPASTGPYRVLTHVPGSSLSLGRNPFWDRATDPVRPALPDAVEVTMGMTPDELDRRLLAGEVDVDLESRGIQDAAQRRILADPVLRGRSDNPTTGFLQYVTLNPHVGALVDVHARRAVHLAADRTTLQLARGGPVTGGNVATSLFPPAPDRPATDRYPTGPGGRGDLAGARRQLVAAGLPDGFRARIGCQRGKFSLVAEALRDAVARVGIELEVELLDVATYFSTGVGSPATVRELGLGLVVNDWGPDFPSPYAYLAPLVHGRFVRDSGNFNTAELDDPRVNALVDATLCADGPQAAALWDEVQRLVMDAAVLLPVTHDKTLLHRNPWVTNVYVHPAFGLYDVQAMGVDDERELTRTVERHNKRWK